MSNLEWALACAARGWVVFPSEGKKPKVKWGTEATTEPALIQVWWERWPQADVCIKTGAESGLVVVDWDAYKQDDPARWPLGDEIPNTYHVRTPKEGHHFYFAHPGYPVANSAGALAPFIDVRGDGGMVVAYPSSHLPLAPCPPAWAKKREWVAEQVAPVAAPYAGDGDGMTLAVDLLQAYASDILNAEEGTLNSTLWRCAADAFKMVASGELREESVLLLLQQVAEAAGHPGPGARATILSARNRGMLEPTSCVDMNWKRRGR